MHDEICYKSPFLKEVILRIDFPAPIEELEKSLPSKIQKAVIKKFPISESQKLQAQEFQIAGQSFQANTRELTQWAFHGKEREKTLTILPESIVLISKSYKSFEVFIGDITDILIEFYKTFKDLSANRIGLRYVNVLELDEANPLSWGKYIDEKMLGIFDFHNEKNLTRAFHILEYNFDGQAVKFQFGIANPDYPSVIRRKQFVLDIDSYFYGAFDLTDVLECINNSHEKIQEIFEKSITDKTRSLMKPVKTKL